MFRNKAVFTLVMLVGLGMIIGLVHNQRSEAGKPSLIQDAISTILAPINSAAHAVGGVAGSVTGAFRSRSSMATENEHLRKQVRALEMDNAKLRELALQSVYLRQALKLQETQPLQMVAAEVVSRAESSWFDSATINCGSAAGVEKGGAVYDHLGLIGQVVEVNPTNSQIVFLTDDQSSVGGTVQRSRSSGLVQGRGDDTLVLTYLPKDADVKVGDVVVSSGRGRVVPKGLPIGRVINVVRNAVAGNTSALIAPSVRFDQVEQVFVAKVGQVPAQ